MKELIAFGILSLTSFFTLINPLGTMPVFMAMTADLDKTKRITIAKKATIVSFFTIIFFAFSGKLLFNFFNISVNSLRVVGGVIFFFMGMDMLNAKIVRTKIIKSEIKVYVNDISITPLAIPMICGPGALTNAIVIMENAHSLEKKVLLVLIVGLIMFLTFLILYSSSSLMKLLGDTGINVMMRLMGLIVMVIAVEFFFVGLKPIILTWIKEINMSNT